MSAIRSVLLHLDATAASVARLAFARELAGRYGAALTAVFGVQPDPERAAFAYSAGAALRAAEEGADSALGRRARPTARALRSGRARAGLVRGHRRYRDARLPGRGGLRRPAGGRRARRRARPRRPAARLRRGGDPRQRHAGDRRAEPASAADLGSAHPGGLERLAAGDARPARRPAAAGRGGAGRRRELGRRRRRSRPTAASTSANGCAATASPAASIAARRGQGSARRWRPWPASCNPISSSWAATATPGCASGCSAA